MQRHTYAYVWLLFSYFFFPFFPIAFFIMTKNLQHFFFVPKLQHETVLKTKLHQHAFFHHANKFELLKQSIINYIQCNYKQCNCKNKKQPKHDTKNDFYLFPTSFLPLFSLSIQFLGFFPSFLCALFFGVFISVQKQNTFCTSHICTNSIYTHIQSSILFLSYISRKLIVFILLLFCFSFSLKRHNCVVFSFFFVSISFLCVLFFYLSLF